MAVWSPRTSVGNPRQLRISVCNLRQPRTSVYNPRQPRTLQHGVPLRYLIEGKQGPFCYCRLRIANWSLFPLYRSAICPPSAAAAGQGSNRLWEARGWETKRTPTSARTVYGSGPSGWQRLGPWEVNVHNFCLKTAKFELFV